MLSPITSKKSFRKVSTETPIVPLALGSLSLLLPQPASRRITEVTSPITGRCITRSPTARFNKRSMPHSYYHGLSAAERRQTGDPPRRGTSHDGQRKQKSGGEQHVPRRSARAPLSSHRWKAS